MIFVVVSKAALDLLIAHLHRSSALCMHMCVLLHLIAATPLTLTLRIRARLILVLCIRFNHRHAHTAYIHIPYSMRTWAAHTHKRTRGACYLWIPSIVLAFYINWELSLLSACLMREPSVFSGLVFSSQCVCVFCTNKICIYNLESSTREAGPFDRSRVSGRPRSPVIYCTRRMCHTCALAAHTVRAYGERCVHTQASEPSVRARRPSARAKV